MEEQLKQIETEIKELEIKDQQLTKQNKETAEKSRVIIDQSQQLQKHQQKMSMDEMDEFLLKIEETSKMVSDLKAGRITVEDIDRKQKDKEIRKQREQDREKQKQQEQYELKRRGRKGKGEKKNYLDFCRFCHLEYELSTPQCLKCNNETQTQQQRYDYLIKRVKEVQGDKLRKQERRRNWELWQKTQSMLYNKMSTNYSKWEYFESSSEEENDKDQEPIVPKDDPQFKALEQDILKRNKQKKEDQKKSEQFKEMGNALLKEGKYEEAVEKYSLGISICRDSKANYLNRALAYMKLGKYKRTIKDCSRILELAEVFEEGYTRSRDSNFKAFIRRAKSRIEIQQLKEAQQDVEEALKLQPKSQEAIKLKQEVEVKLEFSKQQIQAREEQKQDTDNQKLNEWEQIEQFLSKDEPDQMELLQMAKKFHENEQLKMHFYQKQGID